MEVISHVIPVRQMGAENILKSASKCCNCMTTNCKICAHLINDLFTEGLLAMKVMRKHAAILQSSERDK
jgi:hypothetical protein